MSLQVRPSVCFCAFLSLSFLGPWWSMLVRGLPSLQSTVAGRLSQAVGASTMQLLYLWSHPFRSASKMRGPAAACESHMLPLSYPHPPSFDHLLFFPPPIMLLSHLFLVWRHSAERVRGLLHLYDLSSLWLQWFYHIVMILQLQVQKVFHVFPGFMAVQMRD